MNGEDVVNLLRLESDIPSPCSEATAAFMAAISNVAGICLLPRESLRERL
jgi:hypothetical protein